MAALVETPALAPSFVLHALALAQTQGVLDTFDWRQVWALSRVQVRQCLSNPGTSVRHEASRSEEEALGALGFKVPTLPTQAGVYTVQDARC